MKWIVPIGCATAVLVGTMAARVFTPWTASRAAQSAADSVIALDKESDEISPTEALKRLSTEAPFSIRCTKDVFSD
jgi:hypothetical protein